MHKLINPSSFGTETKQASNKKSTEEQNKKPLFNSSHEFEKIGCVSYFLYISWFKFAVTIGDSCLTQVGFFGWTLGQSF